VCRQVGAGPTGLILAATLAMNGVSVRVIERDSALRRGSKGSGIMVRCRYGYCVQPLITLC
jgi:2-polyprenyl-6-methoxyphenol hydroxylase-like FAD-dependent oxidoreductase